MKWDNLAMSIEQSEEDKLLSVGKTVTKADLAEHLFEKVGLNKREAKEFVDLFFEEIRSALIQEESIKLTGFGNFDVRKKSERPGRNPKTGQQIPVTARKVVTFHASQKLKERMQ